MYRNYPIPALLLTTVFLLLVGKSTATAELKMSSVFGDHMVLQQKKPIRIWGWTRAGQTVNVRNPRPRGLLQKSL